MGITLDQALALAPDDGVRRMAHRLAEPSRWLRLGRSERATWGEIAGSGKEPYLVRLDVQAMATRCTCPSRKQPCKHAVALAALSAAHATSFTASAEPWWVEDWFKDRAARAEKAQRGSERRDPATLPASAARARARSAAQRDAAVAQGIAELNLWLRDLVRNGIAGAPALPVSHWRQTAARMVDCKAPGLARRVGELGEIAHSGPGWPERLGDAVALLFLLLDAHARLDSLPPDHAADVRREIGYSLRREDLLSTGVRSADRWLVLATVTTEDDGLFTRRTWLYGENLDGIRLELEFAPAGRPINRPWVHGMGFAAEVAAHPGVQQRRISVDDATVQPGDAPAPPQGSSVADAVAAYHEMLSAAPWSWTMPVMLAAVTPVPGEPHRLSDGSGSIAVAPGGGGFWELASVSGGRPLRVFAEMTGRSVRPLSIVDGRDVVALW